MKLPEENNPKQYIPEGKRRIERPEEELDKETEEILEFDLRSNTLGPDADQSRRGGGLPNDMKEDPPAEEGQS